MRKPVIPVEKEIEDSITSNLPTPEEQSQERIDLDEEDYYTRMIREVQAIRDSEDMEYNCQRLLRSLYDDFNDPCPYESHPDEYDFDGEW